MTFDDGPDPVWSPRLLDQLRRLDARATFFPIAARAAAPPGLIARMIDEGHAVGLHCHEHVRHTARDLAWLREDTRAALASLAAVGVTPIFWRTPWGDTATWSPRVAHENGLRLVGWTADTHDWRGDAAAEMFQATDGLLEDGAIVLAHDGLGPGATREGAAETLAYVELVAAHARRRGLALETLA
jgi:peptidoglycan-N-acetylglucosamine deacetylase